jgi:hypothetical protein
MAFFDEPVWELAAWLMTAAVAWLVGLYFSKRTCGPKFADIARPWLFPSFLSYQVMFLIAQVLASIAIYYVWLDGGWAAHQMVLIFYVIMQVLIVVSHFIVWYFFRPFTLIVGAIVLFAAAAAAVISAVWIFFTGVHPWAFATMLIVAAFLAIMGALTIWLSSYGNSHKLRECNPCPLPAENAWPPPQRCGVVCDEGAPACVDPRMAARNAAARARREAAAMESGAVTPAEDAELLKSEFDHLKSISLDVSTAFSRRK